MQNHFSVEVFNHGGSSVIAVYGELDLASSAALDSELARLMKSDAEQLIIDLRGVDFMDSTGLSVLVKAQQRAEEAGQRFAAVRGSQQVERLLTLTGVAERMTLVDSPEELLG